MTSRRTKEKRDQKNHEATRYSRLIEATTDSLRPELAAFRPPIVRTCLIGPFSDESENFTIYFIFATRREARLALESGSFTAASDRVLVALRERQYPAKAINTFTFQAVSEEEIQEGGGDFAFFR